MVTQKDTYVFDYNGFTPKDRYGVICLKMSGIIDHKDFAQHLLPRLKQNYEQHREIRILAYYEDYKGWYIEDFADDILQTCPYRHHISKLALVNPPESTYVFPMCNDEKTQQAIMTFQAQEIEEALLWANS